MVGYCWGGTMTYVAASELPLACGVAYYGGSIVKHLDKHPKCPVLYHFGALDTHIPLSAVDQIRAADPNGTFHVYEGADHGFNCDMRGSYNAQAAKLARERSLAFLEQRLVAAGR